MDEKDAAAARDDADNGHPVPDAQESKTALARVDPPGGAPPEPDVSVIIPVPPEMERPAALDALENVDYPAEKIEVIIARGRRPARQRNSAAAESTGDVLFFLDDDSIPERDLFRRSLAWCVRPDVIGVGGPALPLAPSNIVEAATDVVFASMLANPRGCKRYASRGRARSVCEDGVILCNLWIRRDAFDEAGGFPDALYPNEENALLQKVLDAGKGRKLIYDPQAVIRRRRPATVGEFWSKVFGYGQGRLEQTLVQPSPVCLLRLGSVFFVLYWIALPVLAWVTPWALAPAVLYLAGNAAMSAKIWTTVRSLRLSAAAFLLFPVMHAAYPCGILWAATGRRLFPKRAKERDVRLEKVKQFGRPWRSRSQA